MNEAFARWRYVMRDLALRWRIYFMITTGNKVIAHALKVHREMKAANDNERQRCQ